MVEYLQIPNNCLFNKEIALSHIYSSSDKALKYVEKIEWVATFKPQYTNLIAFVDGSARYEELEIMLVEINNTDFLYDICRPIYKKIKYPCIIILKYKEKYMMSSCDFSAGIIDFDNNILRNLIFTHWIYPDYFSDKAVDFIVKFKSILYSGGRIDQVYKNICNHFSEFMLSGITKAHVSRLLKDMTGSDKKLNTLKNCTPYKKYVRKDDSLASKYDKDSKTSSYHYRYDLEDLWYAFNNDVDLFFVIEGRNYKNIDELLYRIDMKLEGLLFCYNPKEDSNYW